MEYIVYGEDIMVKCIETSTGDFSHIPRVSSVKKNWKNVHIVKSNPGLHSDRGLPDITI